MPKNLKRIKMTNKILWLGVFFVLLIWSAIHPKDYFTWFLEVVPALIGLLVMALTYKKFPLTRLLYILILLHSIVLMVGGHYTYAEVPLFDTLKEMFDMSRNNYDKVGHFMQGFVPAMIAREIFIRKEVVNGTGWMNYLIVCSVLAFSAFYELLEWVVAEATGEGAEAFLGTQGYLWDTQSDMAWALFGSVVALLLLSKFHDRELSRL
jgi:putative membrane protein